MEHPTAPTLKRSLTLKHIVFFGLAFMAPQTFFSTYGVAVHSTNGMMPTAYAIALIVMLFTAYSYAQLVKAFPNAGAAYTFTQKTISPHVGFIVGWTIIIDYMFSPMISSLLIGISLSAFFPSVPMFVWIVSFVAVITAVNILGIKLAAQFNTYMLFLQLFVFLLFFVLAIYGLQNGKGAGTLFSTLPFYDAKINVPTLLSVVPLLCFSFLGFDAVTTLSEETKDATKTLPRAIYMITLIGGLLFISGSYFAQLIFPQYQSFQNPDSAYLEIAAYIGGNVFTSIVIAVGLTAGFASAVASGTSASRILYAMGRENVLPKKVFGYLSPKFRTPIPNIVLIGVVAMSALFLDLMTAVSFINFGALFAFFFVNLAVIAHYYIREKQRSFKGTIQYLLLPLIGAALIGLFFVKLDKHSLLLGGSWLLIGFLYLLGLTKMFRQPPPMLTVDEVH
ncbi:amino acid permease-associated protein [Brevibacillus agri]|uniref:APC family permease n=1 Tax=Brevibacillus agri TaxID=51101 RepID=A0A3M8AH45_9BACL|nr:MULTISPECIES: APC family permease [Brevibacillus]ELK42127.1 amino acid permease [Brevibacillus agri BAB-2500]MBG9566323.1 Putrescine importer PuuP [Brevibacillus agri]MBY0051591.1 APC family permease [Brevibacillus agri]MCG5254017.1 APC family permease [Brevibacillus agri]MDR9507105.1 APC family permease [Brevibacillus agri]